MRRRNLILLAGLAAASGLLTACGGDNDQPAPLSDVVQLAQANADLSILVEAVIAADLTATLKSAGPFTVFAPNNAAFAAVGARSARGSRRHR